MKNKKVALIMVIFCSLVLAGCGLKNSDDMPLKEQNQEQVQVQNESISGSLKDLLGMGKKLECSWQFSDPESGAMSSGTVWVDGNRSRSEMRVEVSGEEQMNMISVSDGEMSYMWDDGQKTGSKFNIAEMEKMGEEMQENQETSEQTRAQNEWEKMYEYKCKPWRVDENKFRIPTDVEFVDMAQQMKQVQEQTENMKQNMKGMCDTLPEPAKSECEEALQ